MRLNLTDLEKAVLNDFLLDNNLEPNFFGNNFEEIKVDERRIQGSGFITEVTIEKNIPFEVSNGGRWLKASGIINSNIVVLFTVYIQNGKLHAIEGATLGESWPEEIKDYVIKHLP